MGTLLPFRPKATKTTTTPPAPKLTPELEDLARSVREMFSEDELAEIHASLEEGDDDDED